MAIPKSPFYIVQNFTSHLLAEQIVDDCCFDFPDEEPDGTPRVMKQGDEANQQILYERFQPLFPKIEKHFNVQYRGMEPMTFEWYTAGVETKPQCENSQYLRSKWVRTIDRDFTGLLFLSSYQDKTPFDNDYEVYGGKIEFPQHRFSFNPEIGTLIVFPSGPHFINYVSPVHAGDLYMVRMHFACNSPYMHNPEDFPGDYTNWFSDLM